MAAAAASRVSTGLSHPLLILLVQPPTPPASPLLAGRGTSFGRSTGLKGADEFEGARSPLPAARGSSSSRSEAQGRAAADGVCCLWGPRQQRTIRNQDLVPLRHCFQHLRASPRAAVQHDPQSGRRGPNSQNNNNRQRSLLPPSAPEQQHAAGRTACPHHDFKHPGYPLDDVRVAPGAANAEEHMRGASREHHPPCSTHWR